VSLQYAQALGFADEERPYLCGGVSSKICVYEPCCDRTRLLEHEVMLLQSASRGGRFAKRSLTSLERRCASFTQRIATGCIMVGAVTPGRGPVHVLTNRSRFPL
jgi:hypothetical protein